MLMHQHLVLRDEKVEQFYDDIERAMADSDSKYKIITGNFNAKIGTKTKKKTSRAWELLEFAEEHKLIIANTLFQKPKKKQQKNPPRYWTGSHPMGKQEIK